MKDKKLISRIYRSAVIPLFMVVVLWSVKFLETIYGSDLGHYGILPGEVSGLSGIFTSPFIHADYSHLFNNSVPLLVSGTLLFFFFEKVSLKVFPTVFILSGLLTWLIGRGNSYHIGASSGIYGLVAFVFMAGALSGQRNLGAISMLMAFLYGSMVWGILPIDYTISWEGHLSGAFVGVLLAIVLRKELPQDPPPVIVPPEKETNDIIGDAWMTDEQRLEQEERQSSTTPVKIFYIYTPKKDDQQQSTPE